MIKGETVLEQMRRHFKNECVTSSKIREVVLRSGGYLREVLERSVAAGIIEKEEKCVQYVPCYKIDPKNDRPLCPLEPHKPYDESICRVLEVSIENEVRCLLERDYPSCLSVKIPEKKDASPSILAEVEASLREPYFFSGHQGHSKTESLTGGLNAYSILQGRSPPSIVI